jgi:hypothetical protein
LLDERKSILFFFKAAEFAAMKPRGFLASRTPTQKDLYFLNFKGDP